MMNEYVKACYNLCHRYIIKVGDSIEEKGFIHRLPLIGDYISAHINWTDDGI